MAKATSQSEVIRQLRTELKIQKELATDRGLIVQRLNDELQYRANTELRHALQLEEARTDLSRVAQAYDLVREVVNRTGVQLMIEGINPHYSSIINFEVRTPMPMTNTAELRK